MSIFLQILQLEGEIKQFSYMASLTHAWFMKSKIFKKTLE